MKISSVNNVNPNFGLKFPIKKQKHSNEQASKNSKELQVADFAHQLLPEDEIKATRASLEERKMLKEVMSNFTSESAKIYKLGYELAELSHSAKVESWHFHLAALLKLQNYIAQVQEGEINPLDEMTYATASSVRYMLSDKCTLWTDHELINETAKVVNEQVDFMMENYFKKEQEKHPRQRIIKPTISSSAINDIVGTFNVMESQMEAKEFADNFFLALPTFSQDKKFKNDYLAFCRKLQTIGMTYKMDTKEKHHIEFYDSKADSIWKNIAHGNNVMVLCDVNDNDSYSYLQKSFVNLINKPGQKYGSINPKKTNIILLNNDANFGFVNDLVHGIHYDKTKKDTTTIIVGDFFELLKNANGVVDEETLRILSKTSEDNEKGANVQFVFSIPSVTYHKNTQDSAPLAKVISGFAQQTLPLLNAQDAKKYLSNESGLAFIKAKIGKDCNAETIHKAIEVTSAKDGNYPQKAINLLDAVSKFFVDVDEITLKHIDIYLKETESLSEKQEISEKVIIFDTGKNLSDIKGMPMTKADAQSIVRQIQNGTIGTRGFVIMHNSGSAYGGGRRHSAESIAGETGIPMVVINAKDFALKDIDALSQEAGLSELKIKKIVQDAKAQAEANDLNTAMIYIDNFDNFGSNPLYGISSIYEQKAFTQLLAEMDSTRKEGKVNLVVIGSMNMPETLDENILKPYKFLNQITVYQPYDSAQRQEVLEYHIDKLNLKIAGETKKEQNKVLKQISDTTRGFSVVDLIYILELANSVSKERGKDAIDKLDFTEAFLQAVSGRPNTALMDENSKKIVTSHEFGHALTLQIMGEIIQKQGKPWRAPEELNFVALDPRGDYLGAMYPKMQNHMEMNFETVMSDIVCCFGGHSTEKIIYDMDGSWGITGDMQSVSDNAKMAVLDMGLGKRTGTYHISRNALGSADVSEVKKQMIEQDMDDLAKTGKEISDSIVEAYKDFILEMTEEYYPKVATGECLIPSDVFKEKLNAWREKQSTPVLMRIDAMEDKICKLMNECKAKN